MYYAERALLGTLLSEPQRLTNVTGSGPDAFLPRRTRGVRRNSCPFGP